MFCSTCGESLQVSFKFCPKCGKDLANNKEIKVRDETSGKKNMSFKEFKETKEKQRVTFFRKKPGRGKGSGKQQEDLNDTVKINIGIMVPDSVQLRRVRGKSLTVKVPKNATASMLLEAGAEKHIPCEQWFLQAGRYGRETTASNRLIFHRACACT